MSGADDLRTAIAKALVTGWVADDEAHTFEASTNAVMSVLGDPVHRLAILNLTGDVREGYEAHWCDGTSDTFVQFDEPGNGSPGYWVRPRGEATDA